MWEDPVVKEVRETSAKMIEECGNDFHKYCEMIRKHQEEYKRQGIKFLTKEELDRMELVERK